MATVTLILLFNVASFVTLVLLILTVHAAINRKLSSIRAKQIKLDGLIRAKEDRLIK